MVVGVLRGNVGVFLAGDQLKYTLLILSELFSMLRYDHHVSNADARVRRAVSYITDHLNEPLSVPLLAEQAQLNPVYFCSLFRKSMGTTVNQFIRHVRINHAEMLLEEMQ